MEELHSTPATPDEWAVRWIKALRGADQNVRTAFGSWVRHSATYTEAYLRQKMLETELRGLDPQRRIDVQDLVARARARIHADGKIVQWPHPSKQPPPQPRKIRLAAAMVVISALMVGPQVPLHRSLYTTAIGEQQRLNLPDGTAVVLNIHSQLRVDFSPLRREVHLVKGEALFEVAHDARRPFRVRVGTTTVEDVGTTFDVRLEDAGTTVVVTEGRVLLRSDTTKQTPIMLAQNDEAFVTAGATPVVTRLSPRRITALTAWAEQLVVLDDMTLAEAVREFNRYNRVQLLLAGPEVGKIRLGGAFDFRRPLVFAASLQQLGCEIGSRTGDTVSISQCETGITTNPASPPPLGKR